MIAYSKMKPKTYEELVFLYPQIYDSNFYFECGVGWLPIISSLSFAIQQHINNKNAIGEENFSVKAVQVKEKFGGLRFYVNGSDDYVNGMIRMAESISYKMCEVCSSPGTSRSGPWIRVLCDAHNADREEA